MPAKYCSSAGCGGKTEYTVKVPTFCSSCGQPFVKVFGVAKPVSISTPVGPSLTTRSTSIVSRTMRPLQDGEEPDDRYDENEVQSLARELAASCLSDVELVVAGGSKQFSLKDMLDPNKSVDVGVRGTVQLELPPQ